MGFDNFVVGFGGIGLISGCFGWSSKLLVCVWLGFVWFWLLVARFRIVSVSCFLVLVGVGSSWLVLVAVVGFGLVLAGFGCLVVGFGGFGLVLVGFGGVGMSSVGFG